MSWSALGKVAVAAVLAWALVKLLPEALLLVVSLLLAMTLNPVAERLERLKVPRGAAVALLAVLSLALIVAAARLLVPPLVGQMTDLLANLPALKANVAAQLHGNGVLSRMVQDLLALPTSPEVKGWLARPLSWGTAAATAGAAAILCFVFTFYLVLEGKVLYAWILAYVPRRHRPKMAAMLPEVQEVVSAFVRTQVLLSTLFGLFAFGILTALGVPAAVPLAVFAAFCDAIPILGIIVCTAAAAFLALSVSPAAALNVIVLYSVYHALEFYVLLPRLYGKRLRISPLAVLLALVVGGALGGIMGAVLILPFVAAYPVVERAWLSDYLSDEVVDDHAALEQAEHGPEKREVADQVLRGESPTPTDVPRA